MAPTQIAHDIEPVPVSNTPRDRAGFSQRGLGLLVAIVSCAAFGTSGSFATALLGSGWSPVAAVAARITIAALVLAIPTILSMRGKWHLLATGWKAIVLYGVFGVAGCQLFYFNAVTHISVAVALLIEYLAPVLLVGYAWARYGHTPRRMTVAGAAAAVIGLLFVLNVFGGVSFNPTGIAWALGAAICLAVYFVIAGDDESELPSLALAGGGMMVGAVILLSMCALQVLPVHASTTAVHLAGSRMPFWVPVLGLALIAAAFAYVTGIYAARVLGTTVASFISLCEVLFAVLFAWALVGQTPTMSQLIGGLCIVGGVILVRADEMRHAESFGPVVAAEHEEEVARWLAEGSSTAERELAHH